MRALLLVALLCSGCVSPAAPSHPQGQLTIIVGIMNTLEPIASASVVLDNHAAGVTDASGTLVVSVELQASHSVRVFMPGFPVGEHTDVVTHDTTWGFYLARLSE